MSRPVGCLVWLIVLIIVLIVASLMFGGFQKGTKVNGQPRLNVQPVRLTALYYRQLPDVACPRIVNRDLVISHATNLRVSH